MILYVNDKHEIKDVDITKDTSLIPLEVNDEANPFEGWSVAKICCYKVNVQNGFVTMMTPYVDSRLIGHIDQLGMQIEAVEPYVVSKRAYIGDSFVTFDNVEGLHTTAYCVTDNGISLDTNIERTSNAIKVSFEPLIEVATVTISVI